MFYRLRDGKITCEPLSFCMKKQQIEKYNLLLIDTTKKPTLLALLSVWHLCLTS